jgi:hypothetical protein
MLVLMMPVIELGDRHSLGRHQFVGQARQYAPFNVVTANSAAIVAEPFPKMTETKAVAVSRYQWPGSSELPKFFNEINENGLLRQGGVTCVSWFGHSGFFRCHAQRSSLAATADICLERGCPLASRQNRVSVSDQPAYCGLQDCAVAGSQNCLVDAQRESGGRSGIGFATFARI